MLLKKSPQKTYIDELLFSTSEEQATWSPAEHYALWRHLTKIVLNAPSKKFFKNLIERIAPENVTQETLILLRILVHNNREVWNLFHPETQKALRHVEPLPNPVYIDLVTMYPERYIHYNIYPTQTRKDANA